MLRRGLGINAIGHWCHIYNTHSLPCVLHSSHSFSLNFRVLDPRDPLAPIYLKIVITHPQRRDISQNIRIVITAPQRRDISPYLKIVIVLPPSGTFHPQSTLRRCKSTARCYSLWKKQKERKVITCPFSIFNSV